MSGSHSVNSLLISLIIVSYLFSIADRSHVRSSCVVLARFFSLTCSISVNSFHSTPTKSLRLHSVTSLLGHPWFLIASSTFSAVTGRSLFTFSTSSCSFTISFTYSFMSVSEASTHHIISLVCCSHSSFRRFSSASIDGDSPIALSLSSTTT